MDGDTDDKAELERKQKKIIRILHTLKSVITPILKAGEDAIQIIDRVELELKEIFDKEKN